MKLFLDGRVALHHGDSREVLRQIPDASIDACVCDPPYALVSIVKRFGAAGAAPANSEGVYKRASAGFMGQQWDTGETAFDSGFWAEVRRVLKPGGHVIAFAGTRTYHRLACAVEDAGFEIRDMVSWLYGSGFPKSHDVSKGIDKRNGDERPVVGRERVRDIRNGHGRGIGEGIHAANRDGPTYLDRALTSAASAASPAWEGWGTALKPACEPMVLARKPLDGTVAETVLRHGTGALNVDGCRVALGDDDVLQEGLDREGALDTGNTDSAWGFRRAPRAAGLGRWPANVVHDGSADVLDTFDGFGVLTSGKPGIMRKGVNEGAAYGAESRAPGTPMTGHGDSGSAARFFYSAKADADDRVGSKHPTVKPVDLMQWLVRLVTPPGGTVLDPFAGTGTTGEAAWREGFSAVLIEREATYCDDIARRMALCLAGPATRRAESAKARGRKGEALPLFGDAAE